MLETIYQTIFILMITFCMLYVILISIYTYGWYTLKTATGSIPDPSTPISILVPARNEEHNILNCLKDLSGQNYPAHLFEIIVIDDHSEDDTAEIVKEFSGNKKNITLLSLNKSETGKKTAIKIGIASSERKLIITTDADCRFGENWLRMISGAYETESSKMIVGPVIFSEGRNFFQRIQSLEFLSLIASGAGAISANSPILCNGANLAFEKQAFEKVGGYEIKEKYISGDDIFLLLRIRQSYGRSAISFLKNNDAIVSTSPQKNLKAFLQQRIRWISKAKGYTNFEIITTSLIVYLFNYALFAGLIISIWIPGLLLLTLILFILKLVVDFPIYYGITDFVNKRYLLWYLLPLQALYVFYVSIIGFAGNFVGFRWKGRRGK